MSQLILFLTTTGTLAGLGFILDKSFHYSRPVIYNKYISWWYSLSELTLFGLNKLIVTALLRVDNLVFGQKIISLRSAFVTFLLCCAFSFLSTFITHFSHSWHYHAMAAIQCLVIMYPTFLPIITIIRLIIRYIASAQSPRATGLTALLLFIGLICLHTGISGLVGVLIAHIPLYEYPDPHAVAAGLYNNVRLSCG